MLVTFGILGNSNPVRASTVSWVREISWLVKKSPSVKQQWREPKQPNQIKSNQELSAERFPSREFNIDEELEQSE